MKCECEACQRYRKESAQSKLAAIFDKAEKRAEGRLSAELANANYGEKHWFELGRADGVANEIRRLRRALKRAGLL